MSENNINNLAEQLIGICIGSPEHANRLRAKISEADLPGVAGDGSDGGGVSIFEMSIGSEKSPALGHDKSSRTGGDKSSELGGDKSSGGYYGGESSAYGSFKSSDVESEKRVSSLYEVPARRIANQVVRPASSSAILSSPPTLDDIKPYLLTRLPDPSSFDKWDQMRKSSDPGPRSGRGAALSDKSWRIPGRVHVDALAPESEDEDGPIDDAALKAAHEAAMYEAALLEAAQAGVTAENAQEKFPPTACIFVANLPNRPSDAEIQINLTALFKDFKLLCWVKVLRDDSSNPFAFVQFRTKVEADTACSMSRGFTFMGRPLRAEPARANRLYHISRRSGADMTEEEVRVVLKPMGGLDAVWKPTQVEAAVYGLTNGYFVLATYYTVARGVVSQFSKDPIYRVMLMNSSNKSEKTWVAEGYRQDDSHSIFVGNLPASINERKVRDVFENFGHIKHVHMCRKESVFRTGPDNHFCFIEFEAAESRHAAVRQMHGNIIMGSKLRVSYKEPARQTNGVRQAPQAPVNTLSHANLRSHENSYPSPLPTREQNRAVKDREYAGYGHLHQHLSQEFERQQRQQPFSQVELQRTEPCTPQNKHTSFMNRPVTPGAPVRTALHARAPTHGPSGRTMYGPLGHPQAPAQAEVVNDHGTWFGGKYTAPGQYANYRNHYGPPTGTPTRHTKNPATQCPPQQYPGLTDFEYGIQVGHYQAALMNGAYANPAYPLGTYVAHEAWVNGLAGAPVFNQSNVQQTKTTTANDDDVFGGNDVQQ